MALTAASVARESVGSMTMHIVTFATVNTAGDIYTSGIPNIIGVWANATTCDATALNGASAGVTTASTGVVMVAPNVAGSVILYILSGAKY